MSENITLEVINESVALTQVVSSDVIASAESGNVIVEQVLPSPVVVEILSGYVTKSSIINALGYLPVAPNDAIAYAIAL